MLGHEDEELITGGGRAILSGNFVDSDLRVILEVGMVMVLIKLLKTLDAKHLKFHYLCGGIPLFFFC